MKSKINKIGAAAMGLVLAFGLSLPLTACGTSEHLDAAYEVTYVLNDASQSHGPTGV